MHIFLFSIFKTPPPHPITRKLPPTDRYASTVIHVKSQKYI